MFIDILYSLFGAMVLLLLVAAGFAMMFSEDLGKRLLKKAFVTIVVSLVTLALLQHLVARLSLPALMVVSLVAYWIWSKRHEPARTHRQSSRGAERTPVLPSSEHAE